MADNWKAFTTGLSEVLAALPEQAVVIVRDAANSLRYVQFGQFGAGLHAEAVSNEFLPEDQRLNAEQESRLTAVGWSPPDGSVLNWWRELPWPTAPADCRDVADMATIALRDVLGVPTPNALAYDAFVNGRDGGPLDLSHLGFAAPFNAPPSKTPLTPPPQKRGGEASDSPPSVAEVDAEMA